MENINAFNSPELKEIVSKYSHFLKEVRKRLFFTVSVFAGATLVGFFFYEQIIKLLVGALSLDGINIVFTSPFQFIGLSISCGIVIGLIVALPVLVAQILHFLKPALKKTEFHMVINFIPFSLLLFIIGFAFGALIMKWQIEIFLARSISLGIGNILDINGLLTTVFLTSAFMGVGFQFPIVLLLLTRIGIFNHKQLSQKRPWIYLGSFIFALLLPPDSILADILLSLPLIILYELTLVLDYFISKKKHNNHQIQ